MRSSRIESPLQREQLLVFSCLAAVILISWAYMIHMALGMSGTGTEITLACLMRWGLGDITHMFIMWATMMVAMMFPSATPMILMFTTVNQRQGEIQGPLIPTGLFVLATFSSGRHTAPWPPWPNGVFTLLSSSPIIWSSPAPFWAGYFWSLPGSFSGHLSGTPACQSAAPLSGFSWRNGERAAPAL
jgi:hypothetical protein